MFFFLCSCSTFLFFFLFICRPPLSTLFPYTTLFRSGISFVEAASPALSISTIANQVLPQSTTVTFKVVDKFNNPIADKEVTFEDRKSTRLNSSHVRISYAVFCLKKKNTIILSKKKKQ